MPPTLAMLWSASYPGFDFWTGVLALMAIVALAGWWLLRLIGHIAVGGRRRRQFWIAPAGALLLAGLLAINAPLQVRWQFSEVDFDRVVASLNTVPAAAVEPGAGDWATVDVPARIGGYSITAASRVPGGLLFWESHGAFFDDAGFGWFPAGPDARALDNGSFERPTFTHLRGASYAWTASW